MKFILLFCVSGIICKTPAALAFYQSSQLMTLYACKPKQQAQSITSVTISESRSSREQYITIKRSSPIYREKIEVGLADYIDDFTVSGYYSARLRVGLYFYTEDDEAGERSVLKFEGKKEILLNCKWVGPSGRNRSH